MWLLLLPSFFPCCSALVCLNCSDYNGFRSTCSPDTPCTGTRCLVVHLNDAQNFVASCYSKPTESEDFCWTDNANRTLCSCRTQFCNTAVRGEILKNSTTNLLPDVSIESLVGIVEGSTTPPVNSQSTISTVPVSNSTLPPIFEVTTVSVITTTKSSNNHYYLLLFSFLMFLICS